VNLEKILLNNYRNLNNVYLKLNPNLNIIIGSNGQGKTNLIESIYLLGTGTSHRTNIDRELITWDKEKSLIQVILLRKEESLKISIEIDQKNKRVAINDMLLKKVSELVGNLNVVLFSPEDLQLVKGGPFLRRRFLDIEISQVSSYYFYLLQKYNHILKQRNNLLKMIKNNFSKIELLELWDKQLIDTGSKIIKKRLEVINKLKLLARLSQRQISSGIENLYIDYECNLTGDFKDMDELSLIFKNNLVNNRDKEIKRGFTLYGPHRDDIILKINDMDARKYASQGQQRTTALALKLAELEYMKSETGEYPILLLDDVFSELDIKRKNTLIDIITDKIQTFITATELNKIDGLIEGSYKVFRVKEGIIT
jgi:DNA replication and repair protein RecF